MCINNTIHVGQFFPVSFGLQPFPWVQRSWQLRQDFATNITSNSSTSPVAGKLFYSNIHNASLVYHSAGAYECTHFYNADEGCTLLFRKEGLIAQFKRTEAGLSKTYCCLDIPGLGPSPPNWLNGAEFLGWQVIGNEKCRRWEKDTHQYWDRPSDESTTEWVPCKFSFPNHPDQDWYLQPNTYNEAPLPAKMFDLPSPDCLQRCPSSRRV